MKVSKKDVEVKMDIPGAVLRLRPNFGDISGYSNISGEYFSLAAGVDTTPLLIGLEGNLCQCPHWGYVLCGQIIATNKDGVEETVTAEDLFYWPPGHNIKVSQDAEIIMFSPEKEHMHVINHMREMVKK